MRIFNYAPAGALAVLLSSTAVYADVTAQDVWDDWKASLDVYGSDNVTIGSEGIVDGVLTVEELTTSISDDTGTVEATLPWITFTENGDGTVSVEMAEEYTFDVSGTDASGTTNAVTGAVRNSGLVIDVSGTPDALNYDMSADRLAVEIDSVMENDVQVSDGMSLAMNAVAGTFTSTAGDLRAMNYDVGAESVDILFAATDPAVGTNVSISGKVQDVSLQADMQIPEGEATTPETMMADGLSIAGGYSFGASSYLFEVVDPTANVTGEVTVEGGTTTGGISKDSLTYSSATTGIAAAVTSPVMPFPINVNIAQYGIGILLPLAKADAPADFAASFNLTDLTVNEEVWAMLDPGALLPRDPATIALDVAGTMTVLADLVATPPEEMAAMAAPMQLNSVTLNDLTVTIGGASVKGTGAMTFDNTDLTTMGGMPRPEGAVELAINGVNGLMDKLVQLGLLPEDQAMMPRMMLGMFAVPVGDDQLTTKIEFTPDGQMLANGQPLN